MLEKYLSNCMIFIIRFQLFEAVARDKAQAEALINLEMMDLYDFWTQVQLNGPTDIMSSPEQVEELLDFFNSHFIQFRQKIPNVQQ